MILEGRLSAGTPSKLRIGQAGAYDHDASIGAFLVDGGNHLVDVIDVGVGMHAAAVVHTERDDNEVGIFSADVVELAYTAVGVRAAYADVLLCNVYVVGCLDVLLNEDIITRAEGSDIYASGCRPTVSDTVTGGNDLYILTCFELGHKVCKLRALGCGHIYNTLGVLFMNISYRNRPLRHTGLVCSYLSADKSPTEVSCLGKLSSELVLVVLLLREREVIIVVSENGNSAAGNDLEISVIVDIVIVTGSVYGLKIGTANRDYLVNGVEKLDGGNSAILVFSYECRFSVAYVSLPDRIEVLIEVELGNVVIRRIGLLGLRLTSGLFGRLICLLIGGLSGRLCSVGRCLIRGGIGRIVFLCGIAAEKRKCQGKHQRDAEYRANQFFHSLFLLRSRV